MYHNALEVFNDVLLCLTMFYDVLQCLVRHAMIGRLRDRDNAAGFGDNSTEIGDDAIGFVDIAAKVIQC